MPQAGIAGARGAARAPIAAGSRGPALAALALSLGGLQYGCSSAPPPETATTTSALTFPSATAYIPIVQATGTMGDVTTDAQQDARNIVGSVAFPAVYFANTGTDFFVRLRIQENPIGTNGALRQFGWGLLFNTDGNFDKYEYSLLLDASGNPDQIIYGFNQVAGSLGDPSDTAEIVITAIPVSLTAPNNNVEVVPADTCFDSAGNSACSGAADPNRDYFLSFGVPTSIFSLPTTPPPNPMDITQPVQILAGSSSSGQNLTLDLAGCDANPGPNTIAQCQSLPMSLTCGNGIREAGEGCDDGNGAAGDGCNAQCLIETGNACNATAPGSTGGASCASGVCDTTGGAPGTCEAPNTCGNGIREGAEGCDDGGNAAGDGCNAQCLIENGLPCNGAAPGATDDASCASGVCDTTGGAPGVCEAAGSCGNGIREAGEGCDDGGSAAGDGCSAQCLIENGNPCHATAPGATGDASCASGVCDASGGAPGTCEAANSCGNGVLDPGEGCDDGAALAGDGCTGGCLIENGKPCNATVPGATGGPSCASGVCDKTGGGAGVCEPANTCGNGVLEAGEGCDDGRADGGDGCSAGCLVEEGGTCNTDPSGDTGADSCASGSCDPSGKCSSGLGISGGGCSAGGGGAGIVTILLLLLGPWAIRALRRRMHATRGLRRRSFALRGLLTLGALVAGIHDAAAQVSTSYSAERFELTGHRDGVLGVEWADVRGHLTLDAGVWLGYANDPLNVYEMSTGDRVGSLVHNRFGGDLVAAVHLWDRLELGLGASLILGQSEAIDAAMIGGNISGGGLGDLRLMPKLTVARTATTALALMAELGLPTNTVGDYGGDDSVTFSPALAVSHTRGAIRLAANLGYRVRSATRALNLEVDDEVFARAGVGYRFPSSLELDATFDVATAADDVFGAFNRNFAEVRGGAAYDLTKTVRVFGAAGVGVAEGFGTPDWRALVGLRLGRAAEQPAPAPARPLPEPPRDRDGDGILDVADRCPTEPETRNGFQDDDGCPDDPDPDHDNIIGDADRCPDQAEDADGFEDGDGCPDPDNDRDGVLDADDKCPSVAGLAAMQGCPDPDRDGDGVPDRVDNCPDEPGLAENQGCKQKELVKLVDGKLEILDIVYFKLDDAVIQSKSFPLLDNVARVLAAHPQLTKIRVEGHTDSQGDDAYNKKLSQRRAEAVRAYLVKKGLDAARLDAVGFGEEQPKADNATAEGRATNRRVEFVIVGASEGVKTP